jgi:fumarylacetoacetase
MGTGTISGSNPESFGSLLELSWRGSKEIIIKDTRSDVEADVSRKFLHDGDIVTMTAVANHPSFKVGFGLVRGIGV